MDRARIGAPAGRLVEADGHTWLAPLPRALAWRQALISGTAAAGAAVAVGVSETHGWVAGVLVLMGALCLAVLLWLWFWRGVRTRVGVGPTGVLVQRGARTRMLGWQAVDGIVSRVGRPAGSRIEAVIDIAGDGTVDQVVLRLTPDDMTGWREAVAAHASTAEEADPG